MKRRWVFAAALAMLIAAQITGLGDWKSHLAKKAVGEAARAAIGNAIEDAARDAAFDAALGAAVDRLPEIHDDVANTVQQNIEVVSAAGEGIELAMTAADVASAMDKALDAADAAKKAHKVIKTIKKIR